MHSTPYLRCSSRLYFLSVSITILCCVSALADSGVSDGRVALPDGPGSVGGVGENAIAEGNMGAMSYAVPLDVPASYPTATPRFQLSYSSLAGSGVVGIGWHLPIPHVERSSLRGLPRYDADDVFAADGHEELVRIQSGPSRVRTYRARFEKAFVLYLFHEDDTKSAGYWEAHYPDGSRSFFGADAAGESVEAARITHPAGGVFRYLLVETVDRFGHSVRYDYARYGDYPLLRQVRYLFSSGIARHKVTFAYEPRPDAISSALGGFNLTLSHRLSGVEMYRGDTRVGRYALHYEPKAAGLSRLSSVQRFGLHDEPSPITLTFSYSSALDLDCKDCLRPYVFEMGTLQASEGGGVDLQGGRCTLIDIDGDSLPDMLDTGSDGRHRFFLNEMGDDGSQTFGAPVLSQRTLEGSSFQLGASGVQVVDVNGDGFADMIHAAANRVLCNRGEGDWTDDADCATDVSVAALTEAYAGGGGGPLHMRFMDYDGDKRIDLLHTVANDDARVLHNLPEGFVTRPISPLDAVFDDSPLGLGDINGDGLLDPVMVGSSGGTGFVRYRLNLGRGVFEPFVDRALTGATESELAGAEMQDLNGDGLDDVVIVAGDSVKIAMGQSGRFFPFQTLRSSDLTHGELPTFDRNATVLFADMNGSGSTDVVWVSAGGRVRVLELFPMRPNLLTRIDNGIGGVQRIEYGSSARELARNRAQGHAEGPKLPYAVNVVTAIERFATLTTNARERVLFGYRDGYYDGREKRFRGFGQIEARVPSDPNQEGSTTVYDYDVGDSDPYFSGRLLSEQVFAVSGGTARPMRRISYTHEDCDLADVPEGGARLPVRFVCETGQDTLLQEGRPEAEWVTLRTTRTFDGYGDVTASSELGVVGTGARGTGSCAPCTAPAGTASGACGRECLGDERFTETTYIEPGEATGGAWVLGRATRRLTFGAPGGPVAEQRTYYDGKPFTGLVGPVLRTERPGNVRRVCTRQTAEAASDCQGPGWVVTARHDHDAHGNVIDTLDPLGAPNDFRGHRRRFEYDDSGLYQTGEEILLSSEHGPYRLRRTIDYDPTLALPSAFSRYQLVGAPVRSEPAVTRIAYDNFGRKRAVALPGDTLASPSVEYAYEVAAPVSTVIERTRSLSSAPSDLEVRRCVDGLGRLVQTRTRLSSEVFQVDGFHAVNPRGLPVRVYDSYQSGQRCDPSPPTAVGHRDFSYDALNRLVQTTAPDASLYGAPSVTSVRYEPLRTLAFDAEDSDPRSPAFDTPSIQQTDGLGQLIELRRAAADPSRAGTIRLFYDPLGNLVATVDPAQRTKRQHHDLLGRVVRVEDPNAGPRDFAYDLASNLTTETDARGASVVTEFDGANRPIARFDARDRAATERVTHYDFSLDCGGCSHAEGEAALEVYPTGHGQANGRDESGYDLRGRRVESVRSLDGHRFVTRYGYDDAGRATSIIQPDGTRLTLRYDGASRLRAVDGVLPSIEYDARGDLRSLRYENGIRTEYDTDVLHRVQRARTMAPDGLVLQGFEYTRDRVGNLLAIGDASDARDGALSLGVRYDLDDWYRLRSARFDDGEQLDLTFDATDNVLHKVSSRGTASSAHVGPYRYDATRPNAVREAGAIRYRYDAAGRATQRGQTTLTWDHEGRLGKVATPDGSTHYAYASGSDLALEWGPGGRTYHVSPDFEVRDGIGLTYVRLGTGRMARIATSHLASELLADLAPAGGDRRIDIADGWLAEKQGIDPLDHLRAAARRLLFEHAPSRVFLHGDHLESVTLATGPKGEVLGQQTFYESGEPRASAGYVDAYGFSGQRRDSHSGLTHYRFRTLDTHIARWTSPDPLFSVATPNLLSRWGEATTAYAYVGNRHASDIDPSGLLSMATTMRLGAIRALVYVAHELGGTMAPRRAALSAVPSRLDHDREDVPAVSSPSPHLGISSKPPQVKAVWGMSCYRHGGVMSGLEHILHRHASSSPFQNVSRFSRGTTVSTIKAYVHEALQHGSVTRMSGSSFTIEHKLDRVIGTNLAGEPADRIRVLVAGDLIRSAFPI